MKSAILISTLLFAPLLVAQEYDLNLPKEQITPSTQQLPDAVQEPKEPTPVSYTHLTLPTMQ